LTHAGFSLVMKSCIPLPPVAPSPCPFLFRKRLDGPFFSGHLVFVLECRPSSLGGVSPPLFQFDSSGAHLTFFFLGVPLFQTRFQGVSLLSLKCQKPNILFSPSNVSLLQWGRQFRSLFCSSTLPLFSFLRLGLLFCETGVPSSLVTGTLPFSISSFAFSWVRRSSSRLLFCSPPKKHSFFAYFYLAINFVREILFLPPMTRFFSPFGSRFCFSTHFWIFTRAPSFQCFPPLPSIPHAWQCGSPLFHARKRFCFSFSDHILLTVRAVSFVPTPPLADSDVFDRFDSYSSIPLFVTELLATSSFFSCNVLFVFLFSLCLPHSRRPRAVTL